MIPVVEGVANVIDFATHNVTMVELVFIRRT